jgi:ubiquinone/menaquinone biosynthesis C-methylase UbiE
VGDEGKVTAIDLAEGMLAFARRKARAHKVKNIEFRSMDATHLEFPDNTFDVVTCGLAIFYFPDIEGTLREMFRVLKPDGTLGISSADPEHAFSPLSEPYMARLRKTAGELGVNPPAYSETASQTRTKSGLSKLLEDAGFTDIDVKVDSIPVCFTSAKDWWNHGRGSTWGDLVLADMSDEARQDFKDKHLAEVNRLFTKQGVITATPMVLAIAHKPD